MRLPVGFWGCALLMLGSSLGCTLITDIDRTKIASAPIPDASTAGTSGTGGSSEPTPDAAVDGSAGPVGGGGGTGGTGGSDAGALTDSGMGGMNPVAEAGIPEAGVPDSSTSNPSTPDSGSDASVDAGDGG